MSPFRRRTLHALGLSALLAVTAGATTAFGPAAAPAKAAATQRSCAVLVDGLRPGEHHSRVLGRACAADPDAGALRALRADNTLLVTVYQDADYGGAQTSLYGRSGPCDSSGYTFEDLGDANSEVDGISSYRLYSGCNRSDIFTGTGLSGQGSTILYGDQPYVGDPWNDNVNSMGVWHE